MKKKLYTVPQNKKIRVIIDTDAYAEGDDQFAIVHALLTPKFDVVGIIAEQFGSRNYSNSTEMSFNEIEKILELMNISDIPVFMGEEEALTLEVLNQEDARNISEGAQFIIEEALREDERPLFVLNMGAITNLASAYLANPQIAQQLIAVWIGGGPYEGAMMDFNAGNDVLAANTILQSNIELWQIPFSAYTMMEVSFHELYDRVSQCGEIGRYLYTNLLRVSDIECAMKFDKAIFGGKMSEGAMTMMIRSGEGWSLGDNPAVGVLITMQKDHMEHRQAQIINADGSYGDVVSPDRYIRVYHKINSRIILEDLYAKLKYHFSD